jgi:hypothetical protein
VNSSIIMNRKCTWELRWQEVLTKWSSVYDTRIDPVIYRGCSLLNSGGKGDAVAQCVSV